MKFVATIKVFEGIGCDDGENYEEKMYYECDHEYEVYAHWMYGQKKSITEQDVFYNFNALIDLFTKDEQFRIAGGYNCEYESIDIPKYTGTTPREWYLYVRDNLRVVKIMFTWLYTSEEGFQTDIDDEDTGYTISIKAFSSIKLYTPKSLVDSMPAVSPFVSHSCYDRTTF